MATARYLANYGDDAPRFEVVAASVKGNAAGGANRVVQLAATAADMVVVSTAPSPITAGDGSLTAGVLTVLPTKTITVIYADLSMQKDTLDGTGAAIAANTQDQSVLAAS